MNDIAYGVPTSAQIAGMTGKQILQAIIDGELPAPPISRTLSFWLTEVGDGFAAFEGEPGAHLLNPMGGVHGGWALTIIDSAVGCAGQTLLPAGAGYATVETKANFSRPITKDTGRVRAEFARRFAREANDLGRGAGIEPRRKSLGPRDIHAFGVRQRKVTTRRKRGSFGWGNVKHSAGGRRWMPVAGDT